MHAVLKVSPDGRYWVFAYGSQLKVLDTNTNTFVVLPELEQTASAADLEAATRKAAAGATEEDGQPKRKTNKKTGRLDPKQIAPTLGVTRLVDFDSTSSLFLSASDDKAITIRKVGSWEVVGRVDKSFVGKKAANGLFGSDTSVLIADKMGDVNLFAVPHLDAEEEKEGAEGHGQRVLVSADADGRVRVSNFPELFDIRAFCLGHSGVVGDMCLVQSGDQGPMLATGGEAMELFLWEIATGKRLAKTTVEQHLGLTRDPGCMKDDEVPFDAYVSLVQHDAQRNTLLVAVQPFCGLLTFAIEPNNTLRHTGTVALGGVPLAVVSSADGVTVWTTDAAEPMGQLTYKEGVLHVATAGERVNAINTELAHGTDRAVVSHAMDYALRKRSRIAKQAHSTEAMEENKRKVKARLVKGVLVEAEEEEDEDEEEEEA